MNPASEFGGVMISVISSLGVEMTGFFHNFDVQKHTLRLANVSVSANNGRKTYHDIVQFRLFNDIKTMRVYQKNTVGANNSIYHLFEELNPKEFHDRVCKCDYFDNNSMTQHQPSIAAATPEGPLSKCSCCGVDFAKDLHLDVKFNIFCDCSALCERYSENGLIDKEEDYDFEKANEEYRRLCSEMKKLEISEDETAEKKGDSQEKEDGVVSGQILKSAQGTQTVYDKNASFFDSTACDAAHFYRTRRPNWRTWNRETFGRFFKPTKYAYSVDGQLEQGQSNGAVDLVTKNKKPVPQPDASENEKENLGGLKNQGKYSGKRGYKQGQGKSAMAKVTGDKRANVLPAKIEKKNTASSKNYAKTLRRRGNDSDVGYKRGGVKNPMVKCTENKKPASSPNNISKDKDDVGSSKSFARVLRDLGNKSDVGHTPGPDNHCIKKFIEYKAGPHALPGQIEPKKESLDENKPTTIDVSKGAIPKHYKYVLE